MSIEPTPEQMRKVAEMVGGTWAPPRQEYVETAEREYITQTPLARPDSTTCRIPFPEDVMPWRYNAGMTEIDPQARFRVQEFERREWQVKVWAPDHLAEEYDAASNVLRCYGHWRIHRFYVWVPSGTPLPSDDH